MLWKWTKNPRKCVVEFHLGGRALPSRSSHGKTEGQKNGDRDRRQSRPGGGDTSKITRRQQAFTACRLKQAPLEQAHALTSLEANVVRRLNNESEIGHLTGSPDPW